MEVHFSQDENLVRSCQTTDSDDNVLITADAASKGIASYSMQGRIVLGKELPGSVNNTDICSRFRCMCFARNGADGAIRKQGRVVLPNTLRWR